jgi:hypothetical protein
MLRILKTDEPTNSNFGRGELVGSHCSLDAQKGASGYFYGYRKELGCQAPKL